MTVEGLKKFFPEGREPQSGESLDLFLTGLPTTAISPKPSEAKLIAQSPTAVQGSIEAVTEAITKIDALRRVIAYQGTRLAEAQRADPEAFAALPNEQAILVAEVLGRMNLARRSDVGLQASS